jgi:hypothetical protein
MVADMNRDDVGGSGVKENGTGSEWRSDEVKAGLALWRDSGEPVEECAVARSTTSEVMIEER